MTHLQKLRALDPELALKKQREYAARYKERHPEKVKAQDAAKYKKKQEKRKVDPDLDAKLKEQQSEANRKFRDTHPERVKDAQADWYARNRIAAGETAAKWKKENPERIFERHISRKYSLTLADYNRMLEDQGGVCKICKDPPTQKTRDGAIVRLAVDHNHVTGKVRGLLCRPCNLVIGNAREKVTILKGAIFYLEEDN
jgi:hypothetical protein